MADMDQLIAELKEARRVFDAEDKESGRVQALAAVIAFLLDRGVPTELVEPLTVALFSIVDRNLRERHVGMDDPNQDQWQSCS